MVGIKNKVAGKSINELSDADKRARFSRVRVLLADHDARTAGLVKQILFSFGFRDICCVTRGNDVLHLLATEPFDLIITEYSMAEVDSMTMVKAIRTAKDAKSIRRDIPIIMLTARAEMENIQAARDAGINEFIVKPFSAKTISDRIIMVIDNPRAFVDAPGFVGPCRRRRRTSISSKHDRRSANGEKMPPRDAHAKDSFRMLPPNYAIREQLGDVSARDILSELVIAEAQAQLLASANDFISWAKDDVTRLEIAFKTLLHDPGNVFASAELHESAYRIQSRAGIFGYDLGTEVAGLMVRYLDHHPRLNDNDLLILRKHIDVVTVVFNQGIKMSGSQIGQEMIGSLKQLITKLG